MRGPRTGGEAGQDAAAPGLERAGSLHLRGRPHDSRDRYDGRDSYYHAEGPRNRCSFVHCWLALRRSADSSEAGAEHVLRPPLRLATHRVGVEPAQLRAGGTGFFAAFLRCVLWALVTLLDRVSRRGNRRAAVVFRLTSKAPTFVTTLPWGWGRCQGTPHLTNVQRPNIKRAENSARVALLAIRRWPPEVENRGLQLSDACSAGGFPRGHGIARLTSVRIRPPLHSAAETEQSAPAGRAVTPGALCTPRSHPGQASHRPSRALKADPHAGTAPQGRRGELSSVRCHGTSRRSCRRHPSPAHRSFHIVQRRSMRLVSNHDGATIVTAPASPRRPHPASASSTYRRPQARNGGGPIVRSASTCSSSASQTRLTPARLMRSPRFSRS